MADPSSSAGEHDFPEEDEGGGESTVSMTSPQIDPSVPLPISVPPPPMHGGPHRNGPPLQVQMPTAPVPFVPGGQAAYPVHRQPPPSAPSLPTPFGGLTPQGPPARHPTPRPLPAAGMPPSPGVPGASAGAGPPGLKRPQTVIGLAPPPVGAPRPGSPGAGRVALPSGRAVAPPGSPPRPAVNGPADRPPPSSGRGVRPPAIPPSTPSPVITTKDADSTDEQLALPEDTPDSQKEEMPTMAKSAEESMALFGLGGFGTPPGAVQAISPAMPGEETRALPPVIPAAGAPPPAATPLPVLHDRTEEEESTRAVSREEMLRGHDAVVIGDDMESAQGEDATLAVGPGYNEANPQHLAALAATMNKDQAIAQGQLPPEQQGGFPPPPYGQQQLQPPQQYAMDPSQSQPYSQVPQQPWQDPNAQWQQPQQPQQPQQHADPNAYQQQQHWQTGPQSYQGSIGPVSGPHMPVATNQYPQSHPHMQVPQSSPHLQVAQSGHMQHAGFPQQGAPIPYQGHQQPANPFGDWNAHAPQKKPVLSGQVLLLAIVGTVCLAIFITGIVLFATTKF